MSDAPVPAEDPAPFVCPLCERPAAAPWLPFCSRRCKAVDLGNWLTEAYTLDEPVGDDEEDEERALPLLREEDDASDVDPDEPD